MLLVVQLGLDHVDLLRALYPGTTQLVQDHTVASGDRAEVSQSVSLELAEAMAASLVVTVGMFSPCVGNLYAGSDCIHSCSRLHGTFPG